jgi:hypothetical protein
LPSTGAGLPADRGLSLIVVLQALVLVTALLGAVAVAGHQTRRAHA